MPDPLDPLTCTAAEILLASGWQRHEVPGPIQWRHPARSGWLSTDLALLIEFQTREREPGPVWQPLSSKTRMEQATTKARAAELVTEAAPHLRPSYPTPVLFDRKE